MAVNESKFLLFLCYFHFTPKHSTASHTNWVDFILWWQCFPVLSKDPFSALWIVSWQTGGFSGWQLKSYFFKVSAEELCHLVLLLFLTLFGWMTWTIALTKTDLPSTCSLQTLSFKEVMNWEPCKVKHDFSFMSTLRVLLHILYDLYLEKSMTRTRTCQILKVHKNKDVFFVLVELTLADLRMYQETTDKNKEHSRSGALNY